MKKDIIFIIPSLCAGGGQKSLINLLNTIDFKKYNVDLFLISRGGLFSNMIPEEVNIIEHSEAFRIFTLPLKESIFKYIKMGKLYLAYCRAIFAIINRVEKNKDRAEQLSARYMCKAIGKIEKRYNLSIGFLEKTSNIICINNTVSEIKAGWIHNDYKKLCMDSKIDRKYFEKLNYIVTVSEECSKVLVDIFPEFKEKIKVIYNIISPKIINELALESIEDNEIDREKINIISIGRLNYQKAFELAILACKELKDKKYNIRWIVIGEGEEEKKLRELIVENKLEDDFLLLGNKENPYKYMQRSDIYVQTSLFEGKSIAIDEAKIMNMPIVITNFSTARDQIENNVNGLIVDIDAHEIANGVIRIIESSEIKEFFKENLRKDDLGTVGEIEKIYSLIK